MARGRRPLAPLAEFGAVVQINSARGVHLGVKSGRGPGKRLGYSQVANPIYLVGKRIGYPVSRAIWHIAKNIMMNSLRSLRPEAYIDHHRQLLGDMIALRDLFVGRNDARAYSRAVTPRPNSTVFGAPSIQPWSRSEQLASDRGRSV